MAQINGEKQRYEQELLRNETDENRRNGNLSQVLPHALSSRATALPSRSIIPLPHSSIQVSEAMEWPYPRTISELRCSSSVRGEEYNRNKNDKRRGHREQYPQRTNDNVTLLQAIGGTFIQLKPFDHKTEKFDEFMERFNIKYRGHSDIMIGSALGESDSFPNKV